VGVKTGFFKLGELKEIESLELGELKGRGLWT
jgi:hypothetical protein